ncbi:hypothetical protein [Micromonospora chersina]|uniref:hypothetical protein n=1 Tax=Micromonospora chersina TaxID=47854 RepID=UPI00371A774E
MNDVVELLREAASLLRQRAQAATTGPWYEDSTDGIYAYGGPDVDCPTVFFRAASGTYADVQHAAAFASPPVALAVADWLDTGANQYACVDREPMVRVARAYLNAEGGEPR